MEDFPNNPGTHQQHSGKSVLLHHRLKCLTSEVSLERQLLSNGLTLCIAVRLSEQKPHQGAGNNYKQEYLHRASQQRITTQNIAQVLDNQANNPARSVRQNDQSTSAHEPRDYIPHLRQVGSICQRPTHDHSGNRCFFWHLPS